MNSSEGVTKIFRWNELFEVAIPKQWVSNREEGVISFFDSHEGVGALQISFARRETADKSHSQEVTNLAKHFARGRNWDIRDSVIQTYEIAGFPASQFSFIATEDDRTYWCVWHIAGPHHVAFVTYTCAADDAEVEKEQRTSIVRSFRWL